MRVVVTRDELFGVDPDEFVATRDALVRERRAAGDKDAAAAIKALRRPTLPLWAVNQIARRDNDVAIELVEAATAARHAQDEILGGGDRTVLRDALERRKDALEAAASVARRALDDSGRSGEAQAREIENALLDVVSHEPLTDAFARGELTGLDATADALDVFASVAPVVDISTARAQKPSAQQRRAAEKLERHQAEAAEAADHLREETRALADAQAVFDRAERQLEAARRAFDAAEKTAHRTARAEADAAAALERLRRAESE
jgi:hypothetical protein